MVQGTSTFRRFVVLVMLASAAGVAPAALAGDYVAVSPDLELYYREAGTGTPLVIIPGWTGTSAMFTQQLDYFSRKYRVISYDPRSQGHSTKTLENNTYRQHGADLGAFLDALHLSKPVIFAHSNGCKDAYAYFRAFGTAQVRAFVCMDNPPKDIVEKPDDWGTVKTLEDMKSPQLSLRDRAADIARFVQSMVTRPLTKAESDWWVDEFLLSPTYVSILLDIDGTASDYTAEARAIDGKIPVLYVLNDQQELLPVAKAWIARNMPHSQVAVVAGRHLLPWEFPGRFNAVLENFLETLK